MTARYPAALPIAYVVLRVLIILNWLYGLALIGLLFVMPHRDWIMRAFDIPASADADRLILGFEAIAGLGLLAVPLHYIVLKRLVSMVETVRRGDPFVAVNAGHLRVIAWILLVQQLLSMVIGAIAWFISTPQTPVHLDAGFSVNGWLAVILTFVLASVFQEGTAMRDELEGTV